MNTEANKIFAAILIAAILVMFTGFIAKKIVHVPHSEKQAYPIEVAEDTNADGAQAAEATVEPILALLATADVAKGQQVAKICAACHSFDKGGPNRVGPNLWGVVNASHAHAAGYAYSDAMVALKGKPWDYDALNHFLWNPKKAIPGTKMAFAGLKKPEDRAAVIAYLRSLADAPAALPSAAEIAAEAPKETATAETPAEATDEQKSDVAPAAPAPAAK